MMVYNTFIFQTISEISENSALKVLNIIICVRSNNFHTSYSLWLAGASGKPFDITCTQISNSKCVSNGQHAVCYVNTACQSSATYELAHRISVVLLEDVVRY